MLNVPRETDSVRIVVFNDDETPWDFVEDLLRSVFELSGAEAAAFVTKVDGKGRAACGSYPADRAKELLRVARKRIKEHGYRLKLAAEKVDGNAIEDRCALCGEPGQSEQPLFRGKNASICDSCILLGADNLSEVSRTRRFKYAYEALAWHFTGIPQDQLVTTTCQFPGHMRPDVQAAVDRLFSPSPIRFFGIFEQHRYETLTLAALTRDGQHAHTIAPAQYQDIDIGEAQPAKCLNNGLWLCRAGGLRYAVVLSFHREYGQEAGTCVEIGVPAGEAGSSFVQRCFVELEEAVNASRSYRGKVLSLEGGGDYRGRSKGVTVHRLPPVGRDEVILPEETLKLLDRNVLKFVKSRDGLRALGQSTRKGILLYGRPGTGKTHTIRYLASNLAGHTTLLITAGQVALLGPYLNLARLLQPALVVIEDVDLIARDRETMAGPCEESLLNQLLNEMDGLKDDADILFILTTNRPDQLEGALAGRPGRIDQAIEMPLPDEAGREKLVRLYGKGLKLSKAVIAEAVKRSDGVSAAFIKEMMRRTAQASIERGAGQSVTSADLREALDDMLFTGGRLNVKLLGGAQGRLEAGGPKVAPG
ncbi:ClpX C4-type zinc finger [Rhizobiales bacterium GAS188]|nr:ClpX C4-type zinc finger [Rhizobiales bacterium GAS188]